VEGETEVGRLIESARHYVSTDPAASIWKAGLAGEMIANLIGARAGFARQRPHTQETYLYDLKQSGIIPPAAARDFHRLRIMRNDAAHQHLGGPREAQRALALALELERLLAPAGAVRTPAFTAPTVSAATAPPPPPPAYVPPPPPAPTQLTYALPAPRPAPVKPGERAAGIALAAFLGLILVGALQNRSPGTATPSAPQDREEEPIRRPIGLSIEEVVATAIDNPEALASIPSPNSSFAHYALARTFERYDPPRTLFAPGQAGIGWNVPLHAQPTTLSAKLEELDFDEQVTAYGFVKGPDGRIWDVVVSADGSRGFALQSELREAPKRDPEAEVRTTMSRDEAKAAAAALKDELRDVERSITDRLPRDDQVDFGLMRANWYVNEIMIGCASEPECAIPRYRTRLAALKAIRTPHFQRPEGIVVEAREGETGSAEE
jgi:hypothetical protein